MMNWYHNHNKWVQSTDMRTIYGIYCVTGNNYVNIAIWEGRDFFILSPINFKGPLMLEYEHELVSD